MIPTGGEKKSLSALVGRWEGTYTNPGNGRTGTIVLEFSSGGKEAHGDILMIPPDSTARKPSAEETLRKGEAQQQQILEQKRPEIAEVRRLVDGRTAGVGANGFAILGRKRFDFAGEGVVQAEIGGGHWRKLGAAL